MQNQADWKDLEGLLDPEIQPILDEAQATFSMESQSQPIESQSQPTSQSSQPSQIRRITQGNFAYTSEMYEAIMELFRERTVAGDFNVPRAGAQAVGLDIVATKMKELFPAFPWERKKIKIKYDSEKKKYRYYLEWKSISGTSFDEEGRAIGSDLQKETFLARYGKNAKFLFNVGLQNVDQYADIFPNKRATCEFAYDAIDLADLSSDNEESRPEAADSDILARLVTPQPGSSASSRIRGQKRSIREVEEASLGKSLERAAARLAVNALEEKEAIVQALYNIQDFFQTEPSLKDLTPIQKARLISKINVSREAVTWNTLQSNELKAAYIQLWLEELA